MTKDSNADLTEDRLFYFQPGTSGLAILLYKGVCAPKSWTREQIENEVTLKDPPGTSANRWVVKETSDELPENPVQCGDDPERQHWLLNC